MSIFRIEKISPQLIVEHCKYQSEREKGVKQMWGESTHE
jgi:hypothetical protein